VDSIYLAAEIVSASDGDVVAATGTKTIDEKRGLYLAHKPCEAILIIEQERMEVRLDVKTLQGWTLQMLGANDILDLPGFGLRCAVAELYENTPLQPRSVPEP
jgi:hypothetical protein